MNYYNDEDYQEQKEASGVHEEDVYYPPEEQGSVAEDFLRCPECKSPFIKITGVGDMNRRFVKEYVCQKCGATFEA